MEQTEVDKQPGNNGTAVIGSKFIYALNQRVTSGLELPKPNASGPKPSAQAFLFVLHSPQRRLSSNTPSRVCFSPHSGSEYPVMSARNVVTSQDARSESMLLV
jgi:hypothetical protein